MKEFPDPIQYALPFFMILILLEVVWAYYKRKSAYEPYDTFTSLMLGLGSTIAGALAATFIVNIGLFVYEWRLFDLGYMWWVWVLCFIIDDFLYYIFHRSAHRVRWFWAAHVIHHSSQHYNLSTALRQTWTGFFAFSFIFRLPLFFLGFPPEIIFFVGALNLIYQFWIHTEVIDKCPRWFEAIMNTPSHHRVHHATNAQYLDANYAGVFIIWDKLLGTFISEGKEEPIRYGIVRNLPDFNLFHAAFHEWLSIGKDVWHAPWRHKLSYIWRPPGWSHDGSRVGSRELKERWRTNRKALPSSRQ